VVVIVLQFGCLLSQEVCFAGADSVAVYIKVVVVTAAIRSRSPPHQILEGLQHPQPIDHSTMTSPVLSLGPAFFVCHSGTQEMMTSDGMTAWNDRINHEAAASVSLATTAQHGSN
jgi:hypothetical protein